MRGLVVALLALAGCGMADETPTTSCAPRSGLYRVTGRTRSGSCGAWPEQILNLSDTGALGNCTNRIPPPPADACRVEVDSTCPLPGQPGATVTNRGVAMWSADGAAGSASMTLTVDAGIASCSGTYDLTYRKL